MPTAHVVVILHDGRHYLVGLSVEVRDGVITASVAFVKSATIFGNEVKNNQVNVHAH